MCIIFGMETVSLNYKNPVKKYKALSLCLGYFDGIHLGHQSLIKYAKQNAKYDLGLLTFNKPISTFVENNKRKSVITSVQDRCELVEKLGLKYYFILEIDRNFTELSANDFIEFLKVFGVKEIFVGKDFRYGKMASGTLEDLKNNFEVHAIDIENVDGKKVSTQRIGELVELADLSGVRKLLGRNYAISGSVVHGKQIGTKIGFPTINLKLTDNYLLPKCGVYKTICHIDGETYSSLTNIGFKPTIGEKELTIEVHLLNFKRVIYGEEVKLEFEKFIREEKKFDSLESLSKQIKDDIESNF